MTTIKSYTSLEQSKKLAEILPLESADMYWSFGNIKFMDDDYDPNVVQDIPCWSLTALFDVLPDNYIDVDDTIKHPNLMKTKDGCYMVIYSAFQYTSLCNDPIDACYEMIIKLNELNLL